MLSRYTDPIFSVGAEKFYRLYPLKFTTAVLYVTQKGIFICDT
jgi:hypothetical protein